MKMIEFILLATGAVIGAFLRYTIVSSPVTVAGLPVNVLVVNVIDSFLLGIFSVMALSLNIDPKNTFFLQLVFAVHLQPCHHLCLIPAI